MKLLYYIIVFMIILSGCNTDTVKSTHKVERVIDGDTFSVKINNKTETIRLIGIDTPETVKPNTPIEYFGVEASQFTKETLTDQNVNLEFDVQERDKYGRLLAYVYLPDGTMLNKLLLKEGYAKILTVPPNVKYSNQFLEIQQHAIENNKGIWKQQ